MDEKERKKQKIEALPKNLSEAIEAFKADKFIQDVLGEHISTKYVEARQAEWKRYCNQVTEWEIQEYLYKI